MDTQVLEKEFILAPALCFVPGVLSGLAVPCGGPSSILWTAALSCALITAVLCTSTALRPSPSAAEARISGLYALCPAVFATGVVCGLRGGVCGAPSAFALAEKCCTALKEVIDGAGFEKERTAAVVKAFLTGDRSGLDPSLIRIFRDSGASHLLALSGLHIGIVYLLLSRLLTPIGNSPAARAVRSCAMICTTGFYVLMTGASPSIVRAFLFICIREISVLAHRKVSLLHCLCLAVIIQCAVSPESARSAGFKLSYLAVLGISTVNPLLSRLYPPGRGPVKKIWDLASLGISCQIFTAPAVWAMFRTFPRYFLVCNVLAMPVMSVVMYSSIATVAAAACGWSPGAGLRFCEASCDLLIRILEIVSRM